jgi:DNA-binding transcriptional LysR family regulator
MHAPMPWFLRARLKPRQLMLVSTIADEGNIHRAAEVLNISQPAASKLLKDLEDVLGIALFERLPRGMRPTWYGEALIRHARVALASLRQAGAEIDALKTGRFGDVAVGAIMGPAVNLLPQAVAIVAREHPGLRIQIQVESSDLLLNALAQGNLEVMIGRLFERHEKSNLTYERLTDEPVCVMVRPGHPLLSVAGLKLAQLAVAPWIVPPMGSVLRHRFELMFQEEGLQTPPQLIETSAFLFMTKMLQQSEFLAVVPTDVARYYASFGMVSILPIQLTCRMDDFGLITRTDQALSPAAKVVLQALKTAAIGAYNVQMKP